MKYFVPAWQNELDDWAFAVDHLKFDDAINNLKIFMRNDAQCGAIVSEYVPQLTAQLNEAGLAPDTLLTVFDLVQGVGDTQARQILDLPDFKWPRGTWFEYDPFRVVAYCDDQKIAQVIFNARGQILRIERFEHGRHFQDLIMDSRGWVSCLQNYDEQAQLIERLFLNPAGSWRVKERVADGRVFVNPWFAKDFNKAEYQDRQALIDDFLPQLIKQNLDVKQDEIIFTAADQQRAKLSFFKSFKTAVVISRWHTFANFLPRLGDFTGKLVTDSAAVDARVHELLGDDGETLLLPIFSAQFHLGHSQEQLEQTILLVVNDLTSAELRDVLARLLARLDQARFNENLKLVSYDDDLLSHAEEIIKEFAQDRYPLVMLNPTPEQLKPNADVQDADLTPDMEDLQTAQPIPINTKRITRPKDLLTILDTTRVLVDLSAAPDDFIQMAAVSVGVPQINRAASELVTHQQNGLRIKQLSQLDQALDYYLGSMKHWNEALVSSVALINRYSDEMIMNAWQNLW
ncbi:accessory Sec system protein Asp1 [Limosilactobacillus mucosae]|uniref:accessory Sec system protein Asp1 n=1 Tax=Limosilactobacillus mucosae TaxID=97478 RepID=UPI00233ED5F8|nr:accessory Sec system protein Asp1 [Limosilactobacillus mucosae]MDC2844417.1 accessory Sec system protein Asp1 [Limosilactobacillus mucosae]